MSRGDTGARVGRKFNDYFSGHAGEYALYRPTYPEALFEFLAEIAPARELAWDCATGSGQSAQGLARYFERVVATDASIQQLAAAGRHQRLVYCCERAESTTLGDACCDLIAVAQAVHWFDLERFYAEARRVLRRGGVVAVWTYDLMRVEAGIDALIDTLHNETVGAYWPDERRMVDGRYAALEFPFAALAPPAFEMDREWGVDRTLGYLRTWSAARRYTADRGIDPIDAVERELRSAWGSGQRRVWWPLTVRVGRVD